MIRKLKWGVLGVSNFAVRKVIPAVKSCEHSEITGIASRDLERARQAADTLGIPKAYGSYDEMLADPELDVIYNPLPNHLHVEWSKRAAAAGKHVLCEKPISLSTADLRALIEVRNRNQVHIAEGFMIRYHPQWLRAVELARSGLIGEVRAVSTCFSYFNSNPANVRNVSEYGGGGMLDIGCYSPRTGDLCLQHTDGSVPEGPGARNQGTPRSGDSLQRSSWRVDAYLRR
jgi:predicted dehydrogenase